jgi:isopentenyl diphosphate isomerase/L-lactate dehydrogenase-like FMN-dependent dehydrogenase
MSETRVNAGDASKITRDYLDSLLIEMRHIDAVEPSLELKLYGETFSTPIMFAALSHLSNLHPDGMVEAARGIHAANAVMWAGMGDLSELEGIIDTGAKTIKIIKPHADNNEVFKRIEHAEKHGALAVGMDIDHAFGSQNGRGFVGQFPMKQKTLAELKEFVQSTKLPFIIKGVLSTQDAEKCLEAGIGGIVVSHHHGLVDYPVPPLQILPKIAEVIAGQIPIFVDCNIERGLDVLKALALGATAVSVGRALMGPLKEGGAAGITKYIEQMNTELSWGMAVTCSPDIAHVDPSIIWHK